MSGRLDPIPEFAREAHRAAMAEARLFSIMQCLDADDDEPLFLAYFRALRRRLTMTDRKSAERLARLDTFARWLTALDDPDGLGAQARRTVTLTEIIRRAREALSEALLDDVHYDWPDVRISDPEVAHLAARREAEWRTLADIARAIGKESRG